MRGLPLQKLQTEVPPFWLFDGDYCIAKHGTQRNIVKMSMNFAWFIFTGVSCMLYNAYIKLYSNWEFLRIIHTTFCLLGVPWQLIGFFQKENNLKLP